MVFLLFAVLSLHCQNKNFFNLPGKEKLINGLAPGLLQKFHVVIILYCEFCVYHFKQLTFSYLIMLLRVIIKLRNLALGVCLFIVLYKD